ncbi:MAG TPA: ATP12 family protein [Rhizomicrobium sp.]|nr:ATP12 family protein [Rhizomicrobium sp.]
MKRAKRFYADVAVAERDGNYVILLDGKPARTLQGAVLRAPSRALAEAMEAEWRAQQERIDRSTMMLTGLANSAIDHVGLQRGQVIDHILGFGRSDVVYYRVEEPAVLAARQKELWDPLLDWARTKHGLRLMVDAGISYIEQPVDAMVRMQEIVSGLDDLRLAALDLAAALTGSLVIALALTEGHIAAEQAFAAAVLDEIYQAEKWGRDADAESRRTRMLDELRACERFVRLLHK